MKTLALAISKLAAANPAAAYAALEAAIAEDYAHELEGETSDIRGRGIEYYGEPLAIMLDGSDDPVKPAGIKVYQDDFYDDVIIVSVYHDGTTMISGIATEHGFGITRTPKFVGETVYGIVKIV